MEIDQGDAKETGKRESILAGAQEVFSKKGFHDATVEEVAEVAGVGKGTVYLYFGSKRELFVTLIEERLTQMERILTERLRSVKGSCEKLREIIAMQLEFFNRSRDFLTVVLSDFGHMVHELDERTREARLAFLRVVEAVIEEGMREGEFRAADSRIAADALMGMVGAVAYGHLIRDREPLTPDHASQLVNLCLYGLRDMAGGDSPLSGVSTFEEASES